MQMHCALQKKWSRHVKNGSILLLLLFGSLVGKTQFISPATFNVAGSSFKNSLFQFEFSFGEMTVIETFTGNGSSIITSGVLQPATNVVDLSSFLPYFTKDEVKIYPNPTKGLFNVGILVNMPGQATLTLTTINGQLLANRTFYYNGLSRNEQFSLASYPAGEYLISLEIKPLLSKAVKTAFKITKRD
jgi:hypothetical protein